MPAYITNGLVCQHVNCTSLHHRNAYIIFLHFLILLCSSLFFPPILTSKHNKDEKVTEIYDQLGIYKLCFGEYTSLVHSPQIP